jgi:hypothetical protein
VQGNGWLKPQDALLHTWVGEDQCRFNPIKRFIIIIIIIIIRWHYSPTRAFTSLMDFSQSAVSVELSF